MAGVGEDAGPRRREDGQRSLPKTWRGHRRRLQCPQMQEDLRLSQEGSDESCRGGGGKGQAKKRRSKLKIRSCPRMLKQKK
mmetsp:Transcript_38741/g.79035  ORF Transcript_38741/g.79035 Transcript_38741/m.79035 type:complete len:81 (+) Transcript_38741:222-464(+)